LAKSVGAASPLGTAAHAMFAQAGLVGRSEQDCTAMLHVLNELSASPPIRSETQLAD